jgi:hypothetical protein
MIKTLLNIFSLYLQDPQVSDADVDETALQSQVKTLRETLDTIMGQKTKMESSFQADKKKYLVRQCYATRINSKGSFRCATLRPFLMQLIGCDRPFQYSDWLENTMNRFHS